MEKFNLLPGRHEVSAVSANALSHPLMLSVIGMHRYACMRVLVQERRMVESALGQPVDAAECSAVAVIDAGYNIVGVVHQYLS